MKITCNIIRDILPLYVENMVSEDSGQMIEEHIQSCEACKKYLAEMEASDKPLPEMAEVPVKRLQTILLQKRIRTIVISVFLALIFMVVIGANLAVPDYFPYSEELVVLTESSDGLLYAVWEDKVNGYGVSSSLSDDKSGYVYHLVAWDSIWDGKIMKNNSKNAVLNPNGEKVSAVYYYETNGSGEILLYGEPQNPCGVIIKQPKLALIDLAAAIAVIVCILLLLVFRKNSAVFQWMQICLLLPVSYLLSHFFMKGFSVQSYSAAKDFWTIMLVMLPVFCVLLLCRYLIKFISPSLADIP